MAWTGLAWTQDHWISNSGILLSFFITGKHRQLWSTRCPGGKNEKNNYMANDWKNLYCCKKELTIVPLHLVIFLGFSFKEDWHTLVVDSERLSCVTQFQNQSSYIQVFHHAVPFAAGFFGRHCMTSKTAAKETSVSLNWGDSKTWLHCTPERSELLWLDAFFN